MLAILIHGLAFQIDAKKVLLAADKDFAGRGG